MNLKETYLKKQAESGLKLGDRVRITRKADSHEQGWDNGWEPKPMDDAVGKIVIVKEVTSVGIGFVGYPCWYPYFILEKVPEIYFEHKSQRIVDRDAFLTADDIQQSLQDGD